MNMKKSPQQNCSPHGAQSKPTQNIKETIICCVAAKSAGHILPCLNAARAENPQQILYFSGNGPLDTHLLANNPAVTRHIPLPIHRTSVRTVWRLIPAFFMAFVHLIRQRPHRIISTGGLVSLPVCLAAKLLRIPITLYELNAVPGRATRLLGHLAQTVRVCFAETEQWFEGKSQLVAYPHQPRMQPPPTHDTSRHQLNIDAHLSVLFVVGGSQGSRFFNRMIPHIAAQNPELFSRLHIIHQAGQGHEEAVAAQYKKLGLSADVFAYRDGLERYYAAADMIVCRSGAGSLFEMVAHARRCITIPLITKHTSHQQDNAAAMQHMYPELCTVLTQEMIEQNPVLMSNAIASALPLNNGHSAQAPRPTP